jgi:glycosyltransferase involved in cell wall biosynthesis
MDIRIIAPIAEASSIGQNARELAIALSEIGINVNIVNISITPLQAKVDNDIIQKIQMLINNKISQDYVAIHFLPYDKMVVNDEGAKINFAYTGIETPEAPRLAKLLLNNRFKEIIVPTYSNKFDDSVKVINWGVNTTDWNLNVEPLEDFPKNDGQFYFCYVGGAKPSSGYDLVLKAFFDEFKNEPKANLILKPMLYNKPEEREKIVQDVITRLKGESKANVFALTDDLLESSLRRVMKSADCFVAPYRLKVWGTSAIHSMALGVPVIINANTFNKAFTNSENSLLVSSTKKPIDNVEWILNNLVEQECSWYEPNYEDLKSKMRYAFENKDKLKELGLKARQDIEKLDWKNVAMNLLTLVKKHAI